MFPWRLSLTRFAPQWVLWGSVIRVARFRVCSPFPWHLCFSWVKSTEGLSVQDSHTMGVFFRMTLNTNLGEHFLCISPLSASTPAFHPLPGFSFFSDLWMIAITHLKWIFWGPVSLVLASALGSWCLQVFLSPKLSQSLWNGPCLLLCKIPCFPLLLRLEMCKYHAHFLTDVMQPSTICSLEFLTSFFYTYPII